jgi:hypothetical protein
MKKSFYFFPILLLFHSCVNMKVTINTPFLKSESLKKIAIVEVMIGDPVQAIFPLIDAAAFNVKMNKIADEIMDAERQKLPFYRDVIAKNMKDKFNCEIIYGKALQSHPNFEALRKKIEKKEALLTERNNYPVVLLAEGEFNAFAFEKGNVELFFQSNNPATKAYITEICKQLEVDAIAISYSRLNVAGVNTFGISASARLTTEFYIFRNDGRQVGNASAYSKIFKISGREVEDYKILLDEFSILIDPLTTQITKPKVQQ